LAKGEELNSALSTGVSRSGETILKEWLGKTTKRRSFDVGRRIFREEIQKTKYLENARTDPFVFCP